MIDLVCYTLAAFGFVYVVGHAVITRALREWIAGDQRSSWPWLRYWVITLVECPACLGFWVGFAAGYFEHRTLAAGFGCALYTCGANFILGRATGLVRNPQAE